MSLSKRGLFGRDCWIWCLTSGLHGDRDVDFMKTNLEKQRGISLDARRI